MIRLASTFHTLTAPETGRRAVQLTTGDAFCYPLYYFIPSITQDGRYLVYHRAAHGAVQIYRLDLSTAESVALTHAQAANSQWRPYCTDPGRGVLDHRSVLNGARDELVYFDDTVVRGVNVRTLQDRMLFELPPDREAIGQNCVSPDGNWLIYIHHDRRLFDQLFVDGQMQHRGRSRGTALAAFHFDTHAHRDLLRINSPIHHVLPYGAEHLLFCHPATENGMFLTDLRGGWYTHLRTQDTEGGCVCHFVATARGIAYEVERDSQVLRAGLYDPATHAKVEFRLPGECGYVHTGRDPAGLLFFYENHTAVRAAPGAAVHDMHALSRWAADEGHTWVRLVGHWPTYGAGQKAHFHPQLTPDRRWILFTAGDAASRTNHLFLLNVEDLERTEGFPTLGTA